MDSQWQTSDAPVRATPDGRHESTAPDTVRGERVSLPHLCQQAVDLLRGHELCLDKPTLEALQPIANLGYLQLRRLPDGRTGCRCPCPSLFEFYFYYRWLPANCRRFRPVRTPA